MDFVYADFWIVAGTAAPVIAVANQLTLNDALGLLRFFDRMSRDDPRLLVEQVRKGRHAAGRLLNLAYGNLILQAFVLLNALSSLMHGQSSAPKPLAQALATIGIILLVIISVYLGVAKDAAAQLEDARRRPSADEQTAAAIAATLDGWQQSAAPGAEPEPPG